MLQNSSIVDPVKQVMKEYWVNLVASMIVAAAGDDAGGDDDVNAPWSDSSDQVDDVHEQLMENRGHLTWLLLALFSLRLPFHFELLRPLPLHPPLQLPFHLPGTCDL